MELIGSFASPFVRRVRMLLEGEAFKFTPIDVFSTNGRELLKKHTPTNRIPVLIDENETIFDSRLICEHLIQRVYTKKEKRDLVVIDEAYASSVILFQMKKFNLDSNWENQLSKNQLEIIHSSLNYFKNLIIQKDIEWTVTGMWLYCLLDWFNFRNVIDWKKDYPEFKEFMNNHSKLPEVINTDPRLNA